MKRPRKGRARTGKGARRSDPRTERLTGRSGKGAWKSDPRAGRVGGQSGKDARKPDPRTERVGGQSGKSARKPDPRTERVGGQSRQDARTSDPRAERVGGQSGEDARNSDPRAERVGGQSGKDARNSDPRAERVEVLDGPAVEERKTTHTATDYRCGYSAIVGHTNVGKSTLLNRLIGEKIAIVANVPQTTRTRITGIITSDRGQAIFIDTPGFHKPQHRMNRAMIESATEAMAGVDLLLWVIDASLAYGPGDLRVARIIAERKGGAKLFVVLSKIDLIKKPLLLPLLDRALKEFGADEAWPVSAKNGDNCERLLEGIVAALPVGPRLFPEDALTDQPERALVTEIIREKILHKTHEEIPHATAVLIESWEDGEDGITRIDAGILVEREGQKGIVIGAGGAMLKAVGTEARLEIERLLGRRVGLKLWVKVRSRWRDDESELRSLGLV